MIPIAELVAELLTRPSPVLCLDTCELLDVLRGVQGGSLGHSRSFVRIQNNLDLGGVPVVITYLVKHEWEQNRESVRIEALRDLQNKARHSEVINNARSQVGLAALDLPDFEGPRIVDGLIALARRVIDRALVLEQDRSGVDRALARQGDCTVTYSPNRTLRKHSSFHAASCRLFLMPALLLVSFFSRLKPTQGFEGGVMHSIVSSSVILLYRIDGIACQFRAVCTGDLAYLTPSE